MSERLFSILRRKPGYVDLVTPLVPGPTNTYRLKWASNFDGSFSTFLTVGHSGYLDPSIPSIIQGVLQPDIVRLVFNPTTFSIPDTAPIWLKLVRVVGGVEGTSTAPTLVLPPNYGMPSLAISGTAPLGANITESLQIDFPRTMGELRLHNEDNQHLALAFSETGPEITLLNDTQPQYISLKAGVGSIWVRGISGTAKFSATFTNFLGV